MENSNQNPPATVTNQATETFTGVTRVLDSGIKISKSPVSIDSIGDHKFKECQSVQVRQVVTTTYPSKRVNNSNQDNLFSPEAFGFEDGSSYDSNRVAWLDVPNGVDQAAVKKSLDAVNGGTIYRMLSTDVLDVLTEGQKAAIEADALPKSTLESFQAARVVRNADGEVVTKAGTDQPLYSQNFWSQDVNKQDIDYTAVPKAADGEKNEFGG